MLETAELVRRLLVPILIGTSRLVAALLALLLMQRGARALAIGRRARLCGLYSCRRSKSAGVAGAPSSESSQRFVSSPPPYPVSAPFAPITR